MHSHCCPTPPATMVQSIACQSPLCRQAPIRPHNNDIIRPTFTRGRNQHNSMPKTPGSCTMRAAAPPLLGSAISTLQARCRDDQRRVDHPSIAALVNADHGSAVIASSNAALNISPTIALSSASLAVSARQLHRPAKQPLPRSAAPSKRRSPVVRCVAGSTRRCDD